jgi:hypothetical protein
MSPNRCRWADTPLRSTAPPGPTTPAVRRRRRVAAAIGLLLPGAILASVSVYVALGFGGGCGTSSATHTGPCAGNGGDVAVVTFPAALVCIGLGGGVLRGAHWSRWPAVVVGAVLATVVAAGAVAAVAALGGDGSDVRGSVAAGVVGLVLAVLCALPALLLTGQRGAEAFPPIPA